MAAKTINLTFKGYWREVNKGDIPAQSGIYVVYECSYNSQADMVTLLQIIYIGESGNVNERIEGHEKWSEWREYCGANNEICFSFTPVSNPDRELGEAALIFEHKPPVNEEYVNSFPYDRTTMTLSSKTVLLTTNFTVVEQAN